MTFTESHSPAITPRSCVIMISEVPESTTSSLSSSMICAWIVTSRAVVGSSAISRRGLHANEIAMRARWRMPPDSWCGYSRKPPRRVGDAHAGEQVDRLGARLVAAHPAVPLQHLGDLAADGEHRVERAHRVLEHHRHVASAQVAHALAGQREQVHAVERDASRRPGRRARAAAASAPGTSPTCPTRTRRPDRPSRRGARRRSRRRRPARPDVHGA